MLGSGAQRILWVQCPALIPSELALFYRRCSFLCGKTVATNLDSYILPLTIRMEVKCFFFNISDHCPDLRTIGCAFPQGQKTLVAQWGSSFSQRQWWCSKQNEKMPTGSSIGDKGPHLSVKPYHIINCLLSLCFCTIPYFVFMSSEKISPPPCSHRPWHWEDQIT